MYAIQNKYPAFLISTVFLFATFLCGGQTSSAKSDHDSIRSISKSKFDSLVDFSIKVLQTTNLYQISDSGHIIIMFCANTIDFTDNFDSKHHLIGQRFSGGRYESLEELINKTNYNLEITKIYPDFKRNKGMGFYFPKLNMDFGGAPNYYKMYQVWRSK